MEYIFWEQHPTRQRRYPPLQTYYRAHILENNTCSLTSSTFSSLATPLLLIIVHCYFLIKGLCFLTGTYNLLTKKLLAFLTRIYNHISKNLIKYLFLQINSFTFAPLFRYILYKNLLERW